MSRRSTMVLVDVRQGERLLLGGIVAIEVVHKSGRAARLRVSAPPEVLIEKTSEPMPASCQASYSSASEAPG